MSKRIDFSSAHNALRAAFPPDAQTHAAETLSMASWVVEQTANAGREKARQEVAIADYRNDFSRTLSPERGNTVSGAQIDREIVKDDRYLQLQDAKEDCETSAEEGGMLFTLYNKKLNILDAICRKGQ